VLVVADRIAALDDGGAVVAEAVGLDDEVEGGPVEIDLVVVDDAFAHLRGEAGSDGDRAEEEFELGVGEEEGVLVEQGAKRFDTRFTGVVVEAGAQGLGIDQFELVGVVDGALEAVGGEFERDVDWRLEGVVTGIRSWIAFSGGANPGRIRERTSGRRLSRLTVTSVKSPSRANPQSAPALR
jgi:hypothetical protein